MLFLKDARVSKDTTTTTTSLDDAEALGGIRCPRCSWRPKPSSRWSCYWVDGPEPRFDACGAVWNTFSTKGRCPRCSHQWQWTSCLHCEQWSLHVDWYEPGQGRH